MKEMTMTALMANEIPADEGGREWQCTRCGLVFGPSSITPRPSHSGDQCYEVLRRRVCSLETNVAYLKEAVALLSRERHAEARDFVYDAGWFPG
jgi:rubredoxin